MFNVPPAVEQEWPMTAAERQAAINQTHSQMLGPLLKRYPAQAVGKKGLGRMERNGGRGRVRF
jgi:hypothetical protein